MCQRLSPLLFDEVIRSGLHDIIYFIGGSAKIPYKQAVGFTLRDVNQQP